MYLKAAARIQKHNAAQTLMLSALAAGAPYGAGREIERIHRSLIEDGQPES